MVYLLTFTQIASYKDVADLVAHIKVWDTQLG